MQTTDWLNYHHLYYFWITANAGSLSRASDRMRLTRSTLSAQIRTLEEFLGGELFLRSGRAMSLTAFGQDVLHYANNIFRTGAELVEMAQAKQPSHVAPLRVGTVAALPKLIAYRLLEPALSRVGHAPITLRQDSFERLLDDLVAGRIHLVLSDRLPPQGSTADVFAQTLFQTTVCLHAVPQLAQQYKDNFPGSINDAPFLLPASGSPLRNQLDSWFNERDLHVRIAGEFDDAAMLRLFGVEGRGLFPIWSVLAPEVEKTHGVVRIGEFEGVVERIYALSTTRAMCRAELRAVVAPENLRLEELPLPPARSASVRRRP